MASAMPRRFPPSFPVTPPKACTALWYKRRRGDTDRCGALAGCPLSHGCRRASVSAAASVGRWATSHRDVAAPKGGAKSRLPLWGRCPPVGGGEGSVKPPSRCAAVRERRFAVSLVSFQADAHLRSRSRARSKLFCKKVSSKNFTLAAARPLGSQNFTSPFFAFLL